MVLVSETLSYGAQAIQQTAAFSSRAVDSTGPHNDIVRVALAIIECTNLCVQQACCVTLYATLKLMNDAFAAVGWTTRTYELLSGKALMGTPIYVEGEALPNPIMFASRASYFVSDLGAVTQFACAMDWLDLGKVASSAGKLPYFGAHLEYAVNNIPLVRLTFGLIGNIFNALDCIRVMIVQGVGRNELFRLSMVVVKIASTIFLSFSVTWIRFVGHMCNGASAAIALVDLATRRDP
ncbi:MAG TPA: hypothetical protein VN457_04150 [Chlamydiales bacterium]|nr:hypothetical protein [Chlamydiales bacterium]